MSVNNAGGRKPAGGAIARPIERETLLAQILARLEEQLLTGALVPGEQLTLRTLAASMGTSFMPVRDALQHLQSAAALQVLPNRRLIVPILTQAELRDLAEIRFLLEGLAVERAAHDLRPGTLRDIRTKLAALEKARERTGEAGYRRAHWAFHLSIVQASGISTLTSLVKSAWLRIGPNVKLGPGDPGSIEEANTYHRDIIAAIAARDSGAARAALERDIFYGVDRGMPHRVHSNPGQPSGKLPGRLAGRDRG